MKYRTTTQTTVMTNASIANQGGGRRNGEEIKEATGEKIKEQAIGTKIYNAIGTKSKTQWGQNQRDNGEQIKDRAIGRVVVD